MVLSAMYSGVSGLRAESDALSVVGDNISNQNTVGYKKQRAVFQDVLGHSILAGTSSALPGSGTKIGDIQQLFTQGSLSTTGVSTDVALNGDGFFVVNGTVDGVNGNFYTRDGEFVLNNQGQLVNSNGMQVQGYAANADGTFQASLSTITAPTASLPARATENATITMNLDSASTIPTNAWDAQDPVNTSNGSTTMTVYDSLGDAHTMDVYYRKTADNTWDWHAVMSGEDMSPATTGNVEVGTGSLTFTSDGALQSVTGNSVTIPAFGSGATANQTITIDFGQSIADGGTGLSGTTQYASSTSVSSQSQDGYAAGDFSSVAIDGDGVVRGLYTNGQKLAIGQLAVAKFRSNDGLGRAGNGLWLETRDSGSAAIGKAGEGGRGAVSGGSVESSNVDLAEELVGLIQHQRSYSANSKTITTADEMLQDLINIKR